MIRLVEKVDQNIEYLDDFVPLILMKYLVVQSERFHDRT